ncbi:L-alanine-DL-glutamate epimerase-like enolase superfamily enzyme [Bradyrhizobium sp. S3.14.4]
MTTDSFTIRSIEAFCYRYPLATPVVTSFGKMLNRPAVFVRAVDEDGVEGWGEAWSNFPAPGAEHRARLVNEVLAPGLVGRRFYGPAQAFEVLTKGTEVLALQCGEPGPFAQAISGIDLALWDLSARRQRLPLWRLLGGQSRRIKVYASGINPGGAAQAAEAALARGHRALKLKVGFGAETDLANLAALRAIVGAGMLAADANQGWSVDQALEMVPRLAAFDLRWLEEPIRADRPREEWRRLRAAAKMPIAAGENIFFFFERRGIQGRPGRRRARRRSARHREMGRAERMRWRRARHSEGGQDVLPALSRRRHRTACLGASACGHRRRRLARGRRQR